MKKQARIAVIGQVKAGKSSLTNCLIRKPEFLPSDINPWTSIVTQLHFGHPSGQTSGAIFRFFDEEQWYQLATRGGRLGELTDGLLEDYKSEQLFDQVDAMRERAKIRLSDKYESLLGQSHKFNTINSEIMARYVCAGDCPDQPVTSSIAGRFSDITRAAEVFFEQEPFGCPMCIMDTPGINDPLLIREEITQQSLETADFFVVVLSAHQSLTNVDLRLVRLLKALNQDQIVVFVNRVDEVTASADELEKLRKRVVGQLRRELNGKEVPVVLGSAAWADYALNENDEYLDPDVLADFIQVCGLEEQVAKAVPADLDNAEMRASAYVASGLPQLEEALSDMIYHKAASTDLIEAVTDLENLSRQAIEQTRVRIDNLIREDANAAPILTREEKNQLVILARAQIKSVFKSLKTSAADGWQELEGDLAFTINGYSDNYYETILADISELKRGETYHCDLDPLRETLREHYTLAFEAIRNSLVDEIVLLNESLGEEFCEEIRDNMKSVRANTWFLGTLLPKTDALYRTVSLDLTASWLNGLLGFPRGKIRQAVDTANQQFKEICSEMVDKGRSEIEAAIERLMGEYIEDVSYHLDIFSEQGRDGKIHSNQENRTRRRRMQQASTDLETAEMLVETLVEVRSTLETVGGEK
ncbi:dynamin family protein [Profundibacter sp.]